MKYVVQEMATMTRTYHIEANSLAEAEEIAEDLPSLTAVSEEWDWDIGINEEAV